jgi:hypothetical protein
MNEDKNTMASEVKEIVLEKIGFDDLKKESQKKLLAMMVDSVVKQILLDAYEKLSEPDKDEFVSIMNDAEKLNQNALGVFLRDKLADYDELVNKAVEDLKKDIDNI